MAGAGSVRSRSAFSSTNWPYVSTACASMSSLKLYASVGDMSHMRMSTQ